jgi:hypothetical protein
MTKPVFTARFSVDLAPEMDRYLDELARTRTRNGKPVHKTDLVREAVRLYLDAQDDVNGSRRQIAKSLDGKLQTILDALQALQQQNQALHIEVNRLQQALRQWSQELRPLLEWAASQRKAR